MYGARAARVRRFSLLLLDEEEEYVQDWVVTAAWPVDRVAGNWQRAPLVGGRVRLCTRSLFFEPDDVRIPIVRIPLAAVKSLTSGPPVAAVAAQSGANITSQSPSSASPSSPVPSSPLFHGAVQRSSTAATSSASSNGPSMLLEAREVVLMRANMEEVPYTFLRAPTPATAAGGSVGSGSSSSGSSGKDHSSEPPEYRWAFGPCYSPLQPLLTQAAVLLEINRRPREQRSAAL
ncbi:hypothetical protein Vretimale_15405, partial [Volvox reticuliferus]